MAIYRIYPEQDTFISTEVPTSNQGLDEILEIANYLDISGTPRVNRSLILFNTVDITDVVDNIIPSGSSYQSNLKLFLAEASEIPSAFRVKCNPLAQLWINGTGKFGDTPINTSGVSWNSIGTDDIGWAVPTLGPGTTSSYQETLPGGGVWFTEYDQDSLDFKQNIILNEDIDLNFNTTSAIQRMYNNTIENYGFIIKLESNIEFSENYSMRLRYFGRDTHTVFTPYLEFKWDDSQYITGSLPTLTSEILTIRSVNNKGDFSNEEKVRFRLSTRPKYPIRTFTTSSIYTTNYAVPPDTTWAVVDEYTGEYVVDFDNDYTKVSTDENGSYIDLFMNTFFINRYYRLVFKIKINNSETILKDSTPFRIVKNV